MRFSQLICLAILLSSAAIAQTSKVCGKVTLKQEPFEGVTLTRRIGNPNILYPYVRETVSDAIVRAGFPPVLLNPVNFEGLYQAQKQHEAQQAAAAAQPAQAAVTH